MHKKGRLQELDALRGIAALAVVLFHFTMFTPQGDSFLKLGVTGVDLFFIISGFVIFMTLERTTVSRNFLINRVSRLYPTYWVAVTFTYLITILLAWHYKGGFELSSIKVYLGNLTMFQGYFGIQNLDSPYWTLTLEMAFYFAMFLLLIFKGLKYIKPLSIGLIVIAVGGQLLFPNSGWYSHFEYFIPFVSFYPLFFAGIIFYRMMQGQKTLEHYVLIIFCYAAQVYLLRDSIRHEHGVSNLENAIVIAVYLLSFILFVHSKLGFLVSRVTLFLGKISYSLYLIHQKVSADVFIPFFERRIGLSYWTTRVISLVLVIAIAYAISETLEFRLSKLMKKKLTAFFDARDPKLAKAK